MSRLWKCGFLIAVACGLLLGRPAMAAEGIRGNLVSVDWLEKNLQRPELLILDASPAQLHKLQHIPGAVNVDLLSYGVGEVPAAELEKRFRFWGVSAGRKIVIYDQGGSFMATRLFYDLYASGFPAADLFVLNGGMAKWQEALAPLTKEPTPAPPPGTFRVASRRDEVRVTLPEVLTASGDPVSNALVEALEPTWHFGEFVAFDRPGHIPHGIMLPSADFYNADKTFKSPAEIKRMLDYLGIRPEQQIYTYCGGGIAASVPFFALKFMLSYPKVKLFEESELGWLRDQRGLPYWTYDAPYLMRPANWLQGWGGGMLRQFGLAQVSIVDVRPAEDFKQRHVPFARNVPADVFRSMLRQPAKLAETLGQAGIKATDEAVVVSGAGLTPEAALAYLMLERLGHRKVSILIDSLDTWTGRGYPVAGLAVGEAKKAPPPAAVPTNYPMNLREGVLIADAKSTQGLYPKVFVAAGKNLPARAPEGKLVHVPYTELLNGDGTVKQAKDLWNILVKAGVPRYAEIVCIADDPAEAAVNYFILTLMGYPDVKVLHS